MEQYSSFAQVYDLYMDNVPYEAWAEYIAKELRNHQITEGILLDLGCGTGTLTEHFASLGYDMIGVDVSQEMLAEALEKRLVSGHDILYLEQDMRSFELYGTVRAIYSVCDSINYITSYEDLVTVFRLANNYLDPEGIFIFDFNTRYKYKNKMGECTIAESRENSAFIWENYYYEEENINEYELTLFLSEDGENFKRQKEFHYQRGYTLEEVKQAVKEAHMTWVKAVDVDTLSEPTSTSERIYVVAMENGKCRKLK